MSEIHLAILHVDLLERFEAVRREARADDGHLLRAMLREYSCNMTST